MLDTQNVAQDEAEVGLLDDWISRHDLAISLGLSVDTLWRWDANQTGPQSIKLGRKVYYHRSTVRSWLENKAQPLKAIPRGRR